MLSTEQFAEIIALIQTSQDDGVPSKVRRTPRVPHPCHIPITLGTPRMPGPTFIVNMIDISHRGMSFLFNGEFAPGTEFFVELKADSGNAVRVLCKIVHWRPLSATEKVFGVQFLSTTDQPELKLAEPTLEDLIVTRHTILD